MDTVKWVHDNLNPGNLDGPVHLEKFNRKNLAKLFNVLGYKRGAEIGVAAGRFSQKLCILNPGVHLLCVDAWTHYSGYKRGQAQAKYDWQLETARANLASYNAEIVHAFSMDAVRDVAPGSLDFVYIDGSHQFDYVMQDIIEWSKRVRRGGIVSGHDYYHFRFAGVVEAVDVYTYSHGIKEWFLTNDRKSKSFFWVKR